MSATIVSLYPLEIHEVIPFVYPSVYHIDASDGRIPKVLVVEDAFSVIPNPAGLDYPGIKIPQPAREVASSIVNDFKSASVFADEHAHPAVFWVDGAVTPEQVMKSHQPQIQDALMKQKAWFSKLVKFADDEWNRYRQRRSISDLYRVAARMLNLDREWLDVDINQIACPACGTKVLSTQAICQNCRCVINAEAYKKLTFANA